MLPVRIEPIHKGQGRGCGRHGPAARAASHDAQFLRDRLRGKEYLPLAYFEGAAPENSYTPAQPYVLNVLPDPRPQDMEPGYLRLFLRTAGADSPRPIKLRQKPSTGEWFLWEYSSPLSGIRIPAAQDPWV